MRRLLAVGGLAWDRVLRLSAPLHPGGRFAAMPMSEKAMSEMGGDRLPGRLGGGAANAAIAWRQAGRPAAVLGVVSEDADGDAILAVLSEAQVDVSGVLRDVAPSPVTLILVDPEGERTILGVRSPGSGHPRRFGPFFAQLARDLPNRIESLGVSGVFLRAPIAPTEGLPAALPVLAHWDGGERLPPADVVVASAADVGESDPKRAFASARALSGERMAWLALTFGARGAIATDGERIIAVPPAPAARVADATGAGDVFAAGLLEAMVAGADIDQALAQAAIWGARALEVEGSAPLQAPPGAFPCFVR